MMNTAIDSLLTTDEKAVFQLFELIAEAEKYELWTDNDSYIIMQSELAAFGRRRKEHYDTGKFFARVWKNRVY
jgi:hypothetical protein